MSKKMYVCRECGYAFPDDLSHLIESNVQVYCEKCGSPFVLEGIDFKPAPTPYMRKKKPFQVISVRKASSLDKLIQFLNKVSFIPLFIFTFVSFGLIAEITLYWDIGILFERISQGLLGLFLLIYDRAYLAQKVKEKKFNEIFLDSLCWGILGSMFYGLGVLILLKGVFIIIYVITDSENKNYKAYNYGLLAKNSLNNISAKAGFFIILYAIVNAISNQYFIFISGESIIILDFPFNIEITEIMLIFGILLFIAIIVLIIDNKIKTGIKEKDIFTFGDAFKLFLLGVFGTATFYTPIPPTPPQPPQHPYRIKAKQQEVIPKQKEIEVEVVDKPIKITQKEKEEILEEELEQIPLKIDKEERERREEQYELKLHESLLPVKDEKDKKLVKEYFSKIFTLLSKDLKKQIADLKVSKGEKRELLEELAFLTKEEQVKYIDAIISLYKEIPKKLINRIRRLPNVKPKHYDKIVEQLKYMNVDEQLKFVEFLEENA
jgi:DNA-directed RNA polymerase subunit RPC12/RpoP